MLQFFRAADSSYVGHILGARLVGDLQRQLDAAFDPGGNPWKCAMDVVEELLEESVQTLERANEVALPSDLLGGEGDAAAQVY